MNERERDLRFTLIRVCGCIACHLQRVPGVVPPQIHHLNLGDHHGQLRLGDEATIGLCPWHHQGQPFEGWSLRMCRKRLGPSWELEPNEFREQYGTGAELLEFQNALLAAYKASAALADIGEPA